MVRVTFDVCGVNYSIDNFFLDHGPISKLTKMYSNGLNINKDNVFTINRPPELFGAILTLYLTGDLHIPMTSCPGAFLKEMEFWEIDPKFLSNCCFYRLQCHLEEQRTLIKFHRHILAEEGKPLNKGSDVCTSIGALRARVWSLVDYRGRALLDKLYFCLTLFMILLSIMTISLGTCDMFRRNMTNCERLEFMKATDMDHIDIFAGLIAKQDCQNSTIPDISQANRIMPMEFRQYSFDPDYKFIHIPSPSGTFTTPEGMTDIVLTAHRSNPWMSIKVPNMKVPIRVLIVLDLVTLAFFTIDFIVRLLSCPSILSYFKSIINIADTAALIGTYMHLILLEVHKEEKYRDDWVDVLALMQMLRSLRLFRIVRGITAARVFVYTFRQNMKDLSILLLFLVVGICTFSSAIYILEHKDFTVDNVPEGWYWALITMTTVGYGDVYPVSVIGKIVACICAIVGLLLFALTIPIFANHFLTLYQYANLKCFSKINCKDEVTETLTTDGIELKGRVISMVTDGPSETDVSHVESFN